MKKSLERGLLFHMKRGDSAGDRPLGGKSKKKKSPGSKKRSNPIAAFMAACDLSSRDPNSGKLTLYGLFDSLQFDSLPAIFGPFTLYSKISGGAGRTIGTLVLLDKNDAPVSQGSFPQFMVDFDNSGGRVELVMVLPPIEFRKPGIYRLFLKFGEEFVKHPLELLVVKSKGNARP